MLYLFQIYIFKHVEIIFSTCKIELFASFEIDQDDFFPFLVTLKYFLHVTMS